MTPRKEPASQFKALERTKSAHKLRKVEFPWEKSLMNSRRGQENQRKNSIILGSKNDKENSLNNNKKGGSKWRPQDTVLNLSESNLSDGWMEEELVVLKSPKAFAEINLRKNHLTEKGLKLLLKGIKELQVQKLDLSENSMGNSSLDYLISFSKYNKAMRVVDLRKNKISRTEPAISSKIVFLKKKNIEVLIWLP